MHNVRLNRIAFYSCILRRCTMFDCCSYYYRGRTVHEIIVEQRKCSYVGLLFYCISIIIHSDRSSGEAYFSFCCAL